MPKPLTRSTWIATTLLLTACASHPGPTVTVTQTVPAVAPTASPTVADALPSASASPQASASPAASPVGAPALVDGLPLRQSLDGVPDQTMAQLRSYVCPAADQLAAVVPDTDANKDVPIVACGLSDGRSVEKYLLGPQLLPGTEIDRATAGLLGQSAKEWVVNLALKQTGADIFGRVTSAVTSYQTPFNQIAVVLDGVVMSAPTIISAITDGQAQITGNFTEAQANALVHTLSTGGAGGLRMRQVLVETAGGTVG